MAVSAPDAAALKNAEQVEQDRQMQGVGMHAHIFSSRHKRLTG